MTAERDGAGAPGAWLLRERVLAGLGQEELAERSGVSVRTISDLERGRTRAPHPRSVRLLAGALKLPATDGDELVAWYRAGRADRAGGDEDGPGAQAAPVVASAGAGPGAVEGGGWLVPRQLPALAGGFVGRVAELKALAGMLDDAAGGAALVISAVGGMAGIGKTALAAHWAHQAAAQFPGGQLYVNLRGFDPSGTPAAPAAVIRGFLDAFGVPAARIPASIESQAGLYRSLAASRRLLIVLDNARDEQQVRPLLPGSPGSLVLVTSRTQWHPPRPRHHHPGRSKPDHARETLAELTRACLLTEHVPGRYACHDLLRAYAAERAREQLCWSEPRTRFSARTGTHKGQDQCPPFQGNPARAAPAL